MRETLPVTVVTGFLGAGKTTLVNRWLATATRGDIAVIVNEHGNVGIDGELLAERARTLIEVNGGCICCTTYAELVHALDTIAREHVTAQRVLIETSGAASPAGVLRAIMAGGKAGRLILDGVVTVVDGTRFEAVLEQELAREQVGYADVVVVSRADACHAERLAHVRQMIAEHNGAAVVVVAAHGEVTVPASNKLEDVLALRRMALIVPPAATLENVAHVYESVSLVLEGDVDGERFADFVASELGQFSGRIFRIKGILAVTDLNVRMIVQGVADSVEVTFGEPWSDAQRSCRLVVVGFGLERERLTREFELCAAST